VILRHARYRSTNDSVNDHVVVPMLMVACFDMIAGSNGLKLNESKDKPPGGCDTMTASLLRSSSTCCESCRRTDEPSLGAEMRDDIVAVADIEAQRSDDVRAGTQDAMCAACLKAEVDDKKAE